MNKKCGQLLSYRQRLEAPQLSYERKTSVEGFPKSFVERVYTIEDILQTGFSLGVLKYGDICGKRILDLGTGPGFGARVLKSYGGRVIGLDLEENYLDSAIDLGNLKPEEAVRAKVVDYLAAIPPESFDVITGFQVMQGFYTDTSPFIFGPLQTDKFNDFYDLCLHALSPNGPIVFSHGSDVTLEIDGSKAEGTFVESGGSSFFDSFLFFGRK